MDYMREHTVLLALGVGALGLYLMYRKRPKLPPGPMLGGTKEVSSGYLHDDFERLGKRYGDVFSVSTGDRLMIALNSYAAIKEAFIDKTAEFSDRPAAFADVVQLHDEMFTPSYTEKWRKDKKFIQSTLKTFGFGTGKGEDKIKAELDKLVEYLTKRNGEPVDPRNLIQRSTANIITSVLFGSSWELDDPKVAAFITMIEQWSESFGESVFEYMLKSQAKGPTSKMAEFGVKVKAFFRKEIDEHVATLDPDSPRDFIDAYVINRGVANLDYKMAVGTVSNLSPDATAQMAVAVDWILFMVAHHPEVQTRLRREIDDVIGPSCSPTLGDRREMPYTEAVITEVLRMYPPFTVTPPHSNKEDAELRGYHIPANSTVIANLWIVHYDPKHFPEPEKFNPERFLNEKGEFVKSEYYIPFSVGKRTCIGEHFARAETFLFTTTLLQKFEISFPQDEPKPAKRAVFEGIMPLPPPHKMAFKPL